MSDTFNEQDVAELSLLSDAVAENIFPEHHINKCMSCLCVITSGILATLKETCVDSFPKLDSLVVLGSKAFAEKQPFEAIYSAEKPVPEHIQKTIAHYSFPSTSREIRMYSALGTGSVNCFRKANFLFMQNGVRDCLQIGFYISANVIHSATDPKIRHVTMCFDRKHITFTSCTCISEEDRKIIDSQKKHLSPAQKSMSDLSVWCPHVVATCLTRIAHPEKFTYRPPISESLSQLNESQLRTLAYKLICQESARKFLPATQSILDEMLTPSTAPCGSYEEGRDPTGGGCIGENPYWCADFTNLKNRLTSHLAYHIRELNIEIDVELFFDLPPSFVDILDVLSSFRSYRPHGAWELLSIIIKMMHNHDANCLELLQIFVESIIETPAVVSHWSCAERNIPFPSKHVQDAGRSGSFYTSRWLCEALVDVWRLFCLHPKFVSDAENPVPSLGVSRREIVEMLDSWQYKILSTTQDLSPVNAIHLDPVGFNPAIKTCLLSWTNDHLPSTLHLTPEQFRQAIPKFDGAFVSEQSFVDDDSMWRDSFGKSPEFGSFCPPMCGQFGIDFARCQSLVTHGGRKEVALSWVRHLALQMLQQSPHLLAAAKNTFSTQNADKETSSSTTNSRSSSSTQNTEAGRKARGLFRERSAETEALLKNRSVDRFGTILSEWIYCVNYLMDCFYSFYFYDGVVCPPVLTNHDLSRVVMHKKVVEGFNPSYYLPHLSALSAPQGKLTTEGWMPIDMELAFRLGFLVLVLPRTQLILKSREVRLMDHESQLMSRLYRLPLEVVCPWVVDTLRQEASVLAYEPDRFEANVPYALSDFLFTMLAGSHNLEDWGPPESSSPIVGDTDSTDGTQTVSINYLPPFIIRVSRHKPTAEINERKLRKQIRGDYELAFALAKRTLSRNSYIPDLNFTRCQRYQRRSFFLKMLDYYKNKPGYMCDLVESLLDRTLNPSFKCPPLQIFRENRFDEMLGIEESQLTNCQQPQTSSGRGSQKYPSSFLLKESLEGPSTQSRRAHTSRTPGTINATGSTSEDTDTVSDSRIRCANLRRLTRHSVGMAAIDSSAPETTSSDNSPTTSRRTIRVPEEALNPSYYHPPPPGYSTSEDDSQFTIPDGSDEKNDGTLPRIYLGQDYVEHLIDLSKKVRKIAGGPNASSTFQSTHSTTDLSLQKAAFHISLYALGLCNQLGAAARKSRLSCKIMTWLNREALEMKWSAVISLIYSWKGAFPIQEMSNLTKQFVLRFSKEDLRSTRALMLLCRSIMPECIAEGPKFLLTFVHHCCMNEEIREYLLRYLDINESLIMDSPGFSVCRSEYFYSLATMWLCHLSRGEFESQENWITHPSVDLLPQMLEAPLSSQDLPPITTKDLCEYTSRVIRDWEEETGRARQPYLYRVLRLFLLAIDEKLPLQTQSKRLRFHQSLCHPRHCYKHYLDKNASQIIEENGGGRQSYRLAIDANKGFDFKNPLDQAILRVFRVAEELKDEEAMIFVLRFLLHRVHCPVLLAMVTSEAILVFQKRHSRMPAEDMIGNGRIPANRLSIPFLECLFNWTCQLFYSQLERRSNNWREVIDMSLSIHLFYQRTAPQFKNLLIPWESFSHLITRINPSVFELINSSLESIRPAQFAFPRPYIIYPSEIDIDWIKQTNETTAAASRQGGGSGGNGRPNDRRMRIPRTRGRGNGPGYGGRTYGYFSRR
nr:zinc finger SWIM domain containing protein,zinc finger protein swim domain containing protein [Hymenolepis microstoma]